MNIYTQCCGLVIMAVLLFFDMRQKKVGLFTEQVFINTILMNLVSLGFDVVSVLALQNMDVLSEKLVMFTCRGYLVTIIWVSCGALTYIYTDMYSDFTYYWKILKFGIASTAASITVCVLPMDIAVGPLGYYTVGPAVIATYMFAAIYIISTLVYVGLWRKRLGNKRIMAMIGWMLVWIVCAAIQFVAPSLLVIGFGCSLGMMVLYFTLENPESNIDKYYGCFNSHILIPYLSERRRNGEKFSALYLSMAEVKDTDLTDEQLNDRLRSIIDVVNSFRKAKVFKSVDREFVAVFPNERIMNVVYHAIVDRFYYDQYNYLSDTMTYKSTGYPTSLIVLMDDSSIAEDTESILKVFEELRFENADNLNSVTIELTKAHFDELREKLEMVKEIHNALIEDRVEVFYQPIYSTKEKSFVSAEALARIRKKDNSILAPSKFIPIAEETGLIIELGEIVFEKTCQFLKTGIPEQYGVKYIEVNLSVIQCEQADLASKYIKIMNQYGIDPKTINLEITETATIQAKRKLQQNMKQLMDYGVDFSLDDFGNGHSNLDYVIDMPVDIVKLDMSLIQAYERERKAKAVVQAAVKMIGDMELRALTEGVETREQLEEMERIGVNYVQGFYFSKPIPEKDYIEFLKVNQGAAR